MNEQVDTLRGQIWHHLQAGDWRDAMIASEALAKLETPPSDAIALTKSTRTLSAIAEAIRTRQPLDDNDVTRLQEIALAWPRLLEMQSFKTLVQEANRALTSTQVKPPTGLPSKRAKSHPHVVPRGQKPKPSLLKRLTRPKGWAGIAATIACALSVVMVCNLLAYGYLELHPSTMDREWNKLVELENPVDTIVLGDSAASEDLLTGPIADRLGGDVIRPISGAYSSLLMDAWMLQYYINRFGPPRNVILLKTCFSYEREHNLETMSAVPLKWGYWDQLGVAPAWKDGEERWRNQGERTVFSKYCPLYSDYDILASRLTDPVGLLSQPLQVETTSRSYQGGSRLPSEFDSIRNERPQWLYGPFSPSSDSQNALEAMSDQAKRLGFQLYICLGPEWDEAYKDADRQAKMRTFQQWLSQFTDDQYVHLVFNTPMTFAEDQMQNPNHLRSSSARQYTEAMLAEIVAIQNRRAAAQAKPLQMTSAVPDKKAYTAGDNPVITLSLTSSDNTDTPETVKGSVSCLVRQSGKSDSDWVCRALAAAFSVPPGDSAEVSLTLNVGNLSSSGTYDLVVFLRQSVGQLSYETRIELPQFIEVK